MRHLLPPVTVTINDASISENGGSTTAIVTRNTDTTNALVITLFSSDTSEATIIGTTTIAAGQTSSSPIVINSVDDAIIDGTQTVTITAAADGHADGTDTVGVADDDVAGFSIVETGGSTSVDEGGTIDAFTVVLDAQPLTNVTLTVVSGDTGEATVNKATLTFTSRQLECGSDRDSDRCGWTPFLTGLRQVS